MADADPAAREAVTFEMMIQACWLTPTTVIDSIEIRVRRSHWRQFLRWLNSYIPRRR